MNVTENDLRLLAVMQRYFAVKAELRDLRTSLEAARKEQDMTVGDFYHVRRDNERADDVIRTVALRKEMQVLMDLAEGWARGEAIDLDGGSYRPPSVIDLDQPV